MDYSIIQAYKVYCPVDWGPSTQQNKFILLCWQTTVYWIDTQQDAYDKSKVYCGELLSGILNAELQAEFLQTLTLKEAAYNAGSAW
jgi:hypothetical protein